MSRPSASDFYQGFRYHVRVDTSDANDILNLVRGDGLSPNAGFQSVTMPDMTLEASEYREGNGKWTFKQPGIPTFSDVTLMRGVTAKDTSFWTWALMALQGKNYRSDCYIWHYSREEMELPLVVQGAIGASARSIACRECIPTRVKIDGDLDATASDVSLMEVDFAMEYFDVFTGNTILAEIAE